MYKSEHNSCVIIITGGKNFLTVIKKLNLKKKFGVDVYLFCTISLKNPFSILRLYYDLNYSKNLKKIFKNNYNQAIFFCKVYDYITPFFLNKIKTKKILFLDFYNYKYSKLRKKNLKDFLKKIILNFIHKNLNIQINFGRLLSHYNKNNIIYFDLPKSIIKKLPTRKINNYSSFLSIDNRSINKKKVIYLDSNEEELLISMGESNVARKFGETVYKVLKLFESKGYKIFIKKHSREKLSHSLSNFKEWKYILDPIPIELYKFNQADFIIGYVSAGLGLVLKNNPNVNTFSILNLIPSTEINYDYYKLHYKNRCLFNQQRLRNVLH